MHRVRLNLHAWHELAGSAKKRPYMDSLVYTIAQPVLNMFFGFVWGLVFPSIPFQRPLQLWVLLCVFVSVRVVGDWLFGQPHLPWETLRLYVYATCFFAGIMLARYLRHVYWADRLT